MFFERAFSPEGTGVKAVRTPIFAGRHEVRSLTGRPVAEEPDAGDAPASGSIGVRLRKRGRSAYFSIS